MKKSIFSVVLLMFAVVKGFSQMPDNKMAWKEQPLTWADFNGAVEPGNLFDANTNSGISYSWSLRTSEKETEFIYQVETYFYPDLSWVKTEKKTSELLSHEQLHFDITELHARKLRKILRNYKLPGQDKIKNDLRKIYTDIELSRQQMQERYDLETDHSQNSEAQQNWRLFVRAELAKLSSFSS